MRDRNWSSSSTPQQSRGRVAAEVIELRVQSVEVTGQELLTRDGVSLRVNPRRAMRVTDPVAARTKVAKFGDRFQRELQYRLRKEGPAAQPARRPPFSV